MRFRILMALFLVASCLLIATTVPSGWTQPPWSQPGGKGKKKAATLEEKAEWDFKKRDKNGDGFLDRTEATGKLRDEFDRWDENRDGKIDFAEYRKHLLIRTQEKMEKAAQKLAPALNGSEEFDLQAQQEFTKRDKNRDGFLDPKESPGSLRDEFDRWDTNRDGKIDLAEYKNYLRGRAVQELTKQVEKVQEAESWKEPRKLDPPPTREVVDEVDETRPIVYRAGKLPKELPPWFVKLDTNRDGQVSLREWVLGGKSIPDFQALDRNDDGLITIEEMLRALHSQAPATPPEGVAFLSPGDTTALARAELSLKGKGKGKKDKKGKGGR